MLAVLLVHVVLALVWLLDTSISLDFNALINIAFQIINALWPLFVVPMGSDPYGSRRSPPLCAPVASD